jgi:hypothetical protein
MMLAVTRAMRVVVVVPTHFWNLVHPDIVLRSSHPYARAAIMSAFHPFLALEKVCVEAVTGVNPVR